MTESSQQTKAVKFRALHQGEPFVIPNPWDAGTAKVMAALGFEALASTSSGFAFTLGRRDGDVSLDEVLEHTRRLVEATDLPLSVDLENGHGDTPEDVARAVTAVAEAGAVGCSIEDYDPRHGTYPIGQATERVAAAQAAAASLDFPFTLTARADNYVHGNPDLDDTIARLREYERAGADVIYAPRLGPDEIRALAEATSRPINVLARPGLSLGEIVAAGGQRISVGGSLAWAAVEAMADAATEIRDRGDFASLGRPARIFEWLGD